ncbi:uncharacterized protein LOC129149248 [Eptesicus fuscus]|uniref:uncharacterized protein LOC129149248 n=1 Tax=Eptesicus fuscus TaxID=29078 RepID=UPI002403DDF3|nr:uncharacterized protein LOC129149248 [Eptesicus fuscus]
MEARGPLRWPPGCPPPARPRPRPRPLGARGSSPKAARRAARSPEAAASGSGPALGAHRALGPGPPPGGFRFRFPADIIEENESGRGPSWRGCHRGEGRGARRPAGARSPEPGRSPRRARWQHALDFPALQADLGLDSREPRKWTPFSWRHECQPPAMDASLQPIGGKQHQDTHMAQHQEEARCLLITTGEYKCHVQCFCSEDEWTTATCSTVIWCRNTAIMRTLINIWNTKEDS